MGASDRTTSKRLEHCTYEALKRKSQEHGEKTGNTIHVAGWVNRFAKCDKLFFYNDENDEIIKPKRPPKPGKSKFESDEQYKQRLREWEASLPHEKEVEPKGNAMTQRYYSEKLLPLYVDAVRTLRAQEPGFPWN